MHRGERIFNLAASLSVLAWAALGIRKMVLLEGVSVVRVCVSLLHLCVGVLFLLRAPIRAHPGKREAALVLASFMGGALAFHVAQSPDRWALYAEIPFAIGTWIAMLSLAYLGRSFAILPALRTIVVTGPYRLVRHPVYAGELILVASCCASRPSYWAALVLLLAMVLMVARIRVEEAVLSREPAYREYTAHVPWHLLPGVW